jgi:hypothetical protein
MLKRVITGINLWLWKITREKMDYGDAPTAWRLG